MADIYHFSKSSIHLLESGIAASSDRKLDNNKWVALFKPNLTKVAANEENLSSDENTILICKRRSSCEENSNEQQTKEFELEEVEKIRATLEVSPVDNLNYLIQQSDYEQLLPALAESLTTPCIERICETLLINCDTRNEKILVHFFPVYIKRETSSVALNLLVRSYKTYPDTATTLIIALFMNTDIPNKFLEEFFIATDQKSCSQFLQNIWSNKIPTHIFIHHLNTVNNLYKISQKTSEIHNSLLNGLLESSQLCQSNKDYGRLLLTFFQGINKSYAHTHRHLLEQILNTHESPFKRLCQTTLFNLFKSE